MKRFALILILLSTLSVRVLAQDNPYGIDNVCYEYFKLCETLVDDLSNDAFDVACRALLKRANEVGDRKAATLYYVDQMKRTTRIARFMEDRQEANALVERQMEETQAMARETGYMQYYYYTCELVQNYYVNTSQEVHAQALLTEMMDMATREESEYGLWQSQRYIALLYQRQNDQLNARKHLRRVIDIYRNATEESVRRQSLTSQCCAMADTYPAGSDSARFYYNMAEEYSRLPLDTLRVNYYKAQLAALDHKFSEYRHYRDFCLRDSGYTRLVNKGDVFFDCVDALIAGDSWSKITGLAAKLTNRQQLIYLKSLCSAQKREDVAVEVADIIILTLYADISILNDMKMEEISAVLQNDQMSLVLDAQKQHIRILGIVVGLLAAALAGMIAFYIIRNKQNKPQI